MGGKTRGKKKKNSNTYYVYFFKFLRTSMGGGGVFDTHSLFQCLHAETAQKYCKESKETKRHTCEVVIREDESCGERANSSVQ